MIDQTDFTPTCWIWTGPLDGGYGYYVIRKGVKKLLHRVSFEIFKGPIPEGYEVHHTCEIKSCWYPEHLVAATTGEHRRLHMPAKFQPGEPCPDCGELLEGHNLMVRVRANGNIQNRCRSCVNRKKRKYR